MKTKKYKIGNIVIAFNSEYDFKQIEKYEEYRCNDQKTDFTVELDCVKSIEPFDFDPFYTTLRVEYYKKDGVLYGMFTDSDFGDRYYAVAKYSYDENKCKVSICENSLRGITTRTLFSFAGFEALTAKNDSAVFHSSYIDLGGEALLFTGPCGMGKSTQADLWAKYKSTPIINGDKVLLYEKDGVYMAGGLPVSGTSQFCTKKDMPIKAIVKLSQAPYNKIEELKGINAFLAVFRSIYPTGEVPELINKQMAFAQKLSENVKIYHLACTPDEAAVRCLEEKL